MQHQRQNLLKQFKVFINRKNCHFSPGSSGTNEKIGIRTLNSSAPTGIEKLCSEFKILNLKKQIRKRLKR